MNSTTQTVATITQTTGTTKITQLKDATIQNIESAFEKFKEFAEKNEYNIAPKLEMRKPMMGVEPTFSSKTQEKIAKHYLTDLDSKITMRKANKFLLFLFRNGFNIQQDIPQIELSAKEIEIRNSKKAWKRAAAKAEDLRLKYKKEKGDFYKKRVVV